MNGAARVVAPGKVFLFGEYAVLEGAPALVMAIDRYAYAQAAASMTNPALDLVRFARESVRVGLEEIARHSPLLLASPETRAFDAVLSTPVEIDTSALHAGGLKLGLGSSAGAAVAVTALYFHLAGCSLASTEVRGHLLHAARQTHDRLQGERGSGADVAVSVEGGLLRYSFAQGRPRFESTRLPVPLRVLFVPTGVAASTRVLLARVRELRGTNASAYNRRLQVLCDLSEELARDLPARPAADVCLRVHAYAAHLDALGADAGIAIINDPHRRIAEIARGVGCAAKPSGAGGGDLALVFCPSAAAAAEARAALGARGFHPIDLQPDDVGVHLEVIPRSVDGDPP